MGHTVLVADDSRTIRTIFEWVFKGSDYQVRLAENGDEALAIAQQSPPSLVLIDYNMPGRDGYETCRLFKSDAQLQSIPVLMLGGKFADFDEARASQSGADGSIMKPFRCEELLKSVDALIAKGAAGDVRKLAPSAQPAALSQPATTAPRRPSVPKAPPAAPPSADRRPSFRLDPPQPPGAGTPPPSRRPSAPSLPTSAHAAPAPVAIDQAMLRDEVQAAVKDILPGIVRTVLKELITKEVTPHLQRWVEGKVEALVERRLKRG